MPALRLECCRILKGLFLLQSRLQIKSERTSKLHEARIARQRDAALQRAFRGDVIGCNPEAVRDCVTWQFMIRDGARNYNLGYYCCDLKEAACL
ncbi:hypothetical protein AGMMS49975_08450 [Clostridia bacterium]|nr:hypothetical protein AGMMS49975_08450 [Clostridia bacterium]